MIHPGAEDDPTETSTSGKQFGAARLPAWWYWLVLAVTAAAAVACLVILWACIPPTVMYAPFVLTLSGLALLGLAWLVLAIVGWVKFRAWKLSTIAAVVVVLTGLLVMASVPSRAAFAVSQEMLGDLATECTRSLEHRRVGAYALRYVEPIDGGCLIHVEGGFLDSVGFAHLPDRKPDTGDLRRDDGIEYTELRGDWYTFVEHF